MDFSKYKTIQQIETLITFHKDQGIEIPDGLLKRYEELLESSDSIYKHFCNKIHYSDELKECIESTVKQLLEDGEKAKKPGLLLGKIQCGKTRAFVGVIGLAFDKGVDVCVVFTKGTNALISQTVNRLKYDFRDFSRNSDRKDCNTVAVYDIMKKRNGLGVQLINGQKNIIVCKKEHSNVNVLIDVFQNKSPLLKEKKVLIVDDEADFVTRSFRTKNNTVSQGTVGKLIDKFIDKLNYCRYLQVTATPYSLYLQPDCSVQVENGCVKPFKPRFTTLVPIHDKYIGGKEYFIDSNDSSSMYSNIFHSVGDDCLDRMLCKNKHNRILNNITSTLLMQDLRWALMSYFVASAIRQIQELAENPQKVYTTSFVMHISTDTESHSWQYELVTNLIGKWTSDLNSIIPLFTSVYDDFNESIQKGIDQKLITVSIPKIEDVWEKVKDNFVNSKYNVQVVNSDENVNDLLDENGQLELEYDLNIFIGGLILDRGITIEHMLGFMYGRRPQKGQQDTVLQHCRMYGNRSKEDMAVTRLHTTFSLHNIMARINEMDDQLRDWFVNSKDDDRSAVFITLSPQKNIIPCNSGKLAISNLTTIKPFKRITTSGFQTDSNTAIKGTVSEIDNILTTQKNYKKDDVFEIDIDVVVEILQKIRTTYIYNRAIDENSEYEWDVAEMIGCIKYATKNGDGKMFCLHRTNRDMSRKRANGNFVDAPEDGNKDTPLVRAAAKVKPVIIFLKQNGKEEKGWRNAEFYWPVLRMPLNIAPAVFSSNNPISD